MTRLAMPAVRTIAAAARELQSAANRLALMNRNHARDVILAGLFADVAKGRNAAARLEADAPERERLQAEVLALRTELGTMLDGIMPQAAAGPGDFEPTEPPKKRKKRK
jgi:hypothetical protein